MGTARPSAATSAAPIPSDGPPTGPDAFRLLVAIYRENGWLLAELDVLNRRIAALDRPLGVPSALWTAQRDWLRAKRSAALAILRANRREVASLLGLVDDGPRPGPVSPLDRE